MFEKMEIMRMAQAMAVHAGQRQTVIAQNVANADTPGYRARDLPDFSAVYSEPVTGLRQTREGHLDHANASFSPIVDASEQQTPNRNTVSIENQMLKAGDVRHQHDLALAVYQTSLDILRMSIGRR